MMLYLVSRYHYTLLLIPRRSRWDGHPYRARPHMNLTRPDIGQFPLTNSCQNLEMNRTLVNHLLSCLVRNLCLRRSIIQLFTQLTLAYSRKFPTHLKRIRASCGSRNTVHIRVHSPAPISSWLSCTSPRNTSNPVKGSKPK